MSNILIGKDVPCNLSVLYHLNSKGRKLIASLKTVYFSDDQMAILMSAKEDHLRCE